MNNVNFGREGSYRCVRGCTVAGSHSGVSGERARNPMGVEGNFVGMSRRYDDWVNEGRFTRDPASWLFDCIRGTKFTDVEGLV